MSDKHIADLERIEKNLFVTSVQIEKLNLEEWLTNYEKEAKDIDILADGYPHTYNLYLPPGGLAIQKIMIDGYPTGAKIRILNSVIRNLTFTEIQGKDIPYYY